MRDKIAIVDIDDTLADMRSVICNLLNDKYKMDYHWTSWRTFRVEELYGISYDDFFHMLKNHGVIEQMKPHAESISFMQGLRNAGYNITLLTARAWHPDAKNVTRRWLAQHNIEYDNLMVCDFSQCKSDIINDNFNHVEFTVDDSLSHCTNYVKNDRIRKVFIYDMPWNKCELLDKSRAVRVKTLTEILENN